ncbi:type IV conjugative transfer system protein TraL [Galenea microaerophila]
MGDSSRSIPTRADNVVPILFWEPTEFILMVSILGFSFLINMVIVGLIIVFIFMKIMKVMRRGSKRGASQHALWAFGLNIDPILKKRFPKPYENEFIS